MGHAEAGDATADVFATVWRRIDEVTDESAMGWLFGVARGVILNRWRSRDRRRRLRTRVGGLANPGPVGPDVVVVRNEETAAVIEALHRLRESDQEVLVMAAWDELTAPQIAEVLGISVSAAEQRIHRAKRRLGKALKLPATRQQPAGANETEGGDA